MTRPPSFLAARQQTARQARLQNIQHNRHMIGQYDAVEMTERAAASWPYGSMGEYVEDEPCS